MAGGHTIRNPEPIYGLAVQGVVHPDRILRKSGARPGDVVVLSKPLGTGLTLAAGSEVEKAAAITGMKTVNRRASELLVAAGSSVHAVTDVTGYGLAGHGWEVAQRSEVRLIVDTSSLEMYPGALRIAEEGGRTGGDPRNREYVDGHVETTADDARAAICYDPQTSGGLLASVEPDLADDLVGQGFWRVGEVEAGAAGIVLA